MIPKGRHLRGSYLHATGRTQGFLPSWCLTSERAASARRCWKLARQWCRCGRRAVTTTSAATTGTSGSWTGWCRTSRTVTASTGPRTRWRCSGCGNPREGQDRAVRFRGDADQPALHHPLRAGPAAPGRQAHPGGVPEDDLRPAGPLQEPVQAGDRGRLWGARSLLGL
jgi:hypothetical protein